MPFHIFQHWIADVKKTSIPLDQVLKKVVTLFNRSGSKRAEPPKFTINTSSQTLVSPSAGLTIVANVAIATGPALLGAPRSSATKLVYYIIYKKIFSLRSQEVSILLNLP